ncbi:MAG: hypothetical protein ACKVT2_08025 [Saprospiraceae bacterium]
MKNIIRLIAIAIPITLFVYFGANQPQSMSSSDSDEHYKEECQNEGCNGEEIDEMAGSYEGECREESCNFEEVREIAGATNSVNAMLNHMIARGYNISSCHFWGGCVISPGNNTTSGDVTFGALCTQSSINQHWNDFDFDQGDWDDGFGYSDPCNINLPLGRTFNALNLLDFFGTSGPDANGNWLGWFYAYASSQIDELDALCGFGNTSGCSTFATNFSGAQDNRTELYWPFFYHNVMSVPSRAATIVHESRHAGGKGHNCSSCPNGGSCDTDWAYNGAIRYEVMYCWWLRSNGTGVTTALRQLARARGNTALGNNFCNGNPTRAQVFAPTAVSNPNGAFQIP